MFSIDYERLVALLLPTFLRRPVLFSLLRAAVSQLKVLYQSFCGSRDEHNYRLTHNGQVCYLRACLNDHFKSRIGEFYIMSVERDGEWLYAITESGEGIPIAIGEDHNPNDGSIPVLANELALSEAQNEFVISVPSDIYDSSLEEVKALVNKYKLITKQPVYISQTS